MESVSVLQPGTEISPGFGNSTQTITPTGSNRALSQDLFTDTEAVVVTVLMACMCVFGLFTNTLTFFVIKTSRSLSKNPFNILLMSLCVSDFMSALHSPLYLYRQVWGYYDYRLPEGVCRLTNGLKYLTDSVTVQHILSFSVFRFISIQFPHHIKRFTTKMAKVTAIVIWIETFFTASLVYFITSKVYPYKPGLYKTSCTAVGREWTETMIQYVRYAMPILLFLPLVGIFICTIGFVTMMIKRKRRREITRRINNKKQVKQENFALIQVLLIVASFLIGYLPSAGYRLTKTIGLRRVFSRRSKWLFTIISFLLLRIMECLNPVFYNVASKQMRAATTQFLGFNSGNSSSTEENNHIGEGINRKRSIPK